MPAPRVLVNAISLTQGGGRSYVRNLLREVSRDSRGFEFVVLTAAGKLSPEEASGVEIAEVSLPRERSVLRTVGRVLYEETCLPRRALAYDLVYCLADLSPAWGRIPTIVALRNFNIYDRRFYDGPRTRLLLRLVQMGARRARGIVCPTRAAANAIAPVVGVDPERFSIVHHGIAPEAFLGASAADRTEARYLFYPAALERHKNMPRLFEALQYIDPAIHLWIAGGADLDPEWAAHVRDQVRVRGLEGRVRFLGQVPYEKILGYYRGAEMLVFPSMVETFGHPLLEAMVAGTPVAASDIPSFREVAGDVAAYFDPNDARAIARTVEAVLERPEQARARIARGHERAKGFTWERSVDLLCECFERGLEPA